MIFKKGNKIDLGNPENKYDVIVVSYNKLSNDYRKGNS